MVAITGHAAHELAQDCLRRSPYPAVRRVSCEYCEGVLVLRGRLPSYYHKQVAQEAVARLEGVTGIVNEVEVVIEPGSPLPRDLRED